MNAYHPLNQRRRFRQAADPAPPALPPVPESLLPIRNRFVDSFTTTENGNVVRFNLSRHGMLFRLDATSTREFFMLVWQHSANGGTDSREMTTDEAVYSLAVVRSLMSPDDLKRHDGRLTRLEANLPKTQYPDRKVRADAYDERFEFCRYGMQFTVSKSAPYHCYVTARDRPSQNGSRDMRPDELVAARKILVAQLSINDNFDYAHVLEGLRLKIAQAMPTPAPAPAVK